jgi:hypothetical protein
VSVPWPEPCHTEDGYWFTAGWNRVGSAGVGQFPHVEGYWYAKCYLGHVVSGRTLPSE